MLEKIHKNALSGNGISKEDALFIADMPLSETPSLFPIANETRIKHRKDFVDLCSILNAKSGACPENCGFCAQSAKSKTNVNVYPLLPVKEVVERAREIRGQGVRRFCIVISGRSATKKDLALIAKMVEEIRNLGILPCATLGLLGYEDLKLLKSAGLERYHHNLETSRRFFPEVCSTHTYDDKLRTIEAVKNAGLSLCSGGIFGLGEEWEDRIEMAVELRKLSVDSVPINYLIPVKGTGLANLELLKPLEALKIASLYRLMLPKKEIRLCGGRSQTLGEFGSMVFMAGADGLLTGNYLTTTGRVVKDDLRLIEEFGLRYK